MSKIKMFYDSKGRTLSIWFDDPKKEVISEEVGDGTIINKDKQGKVIGFERLYVKLPEQKLKATPPIDFSFI